MDAIIFANGDLNRGPAVDAVLAQAARALCIAADGGVRHMLPLAIQPHVVIGDMDSVSEAMLQTCRDAGAEILLYPPEKDETDLELALNHAVQQGATTIRVLGAVGDRLDQSLANILLLTLPVLDRCRVTIVAGKQQAWLIEPGEHTVAGAASDTLSLIPLGGDAVGVSTQGLRYPLHDETLAFGPARGVSNVFEGAPAAVALQEGLLLVVHTLGRA